MSARWLLAAVLLLAGATAEASGYSLGGALGGGYWRTDEWAADGHDAVDAWDWDAEATVTGSPLRPGLLQFLAGARYRSLRSYYSEARSRTDNFGFRLNAAAFGDSIAPVSLGGSRYWTQFLTDSDELRTGASVITSVGGTAALIAHGYPSLHLTLGHADIDNRSFGGVHTDAQTNTLTASASQATKTQEYQLTYGTGWNTGSWVEDNYRSHDVNFLAAVGVTDRLRFRLNDRYFLRLPTRDAPTNPRYDDNGLGAGVQWFPREGTQAAFDYGYRHLLATAPGTRVEQTAHGLTASASQLVTPEVLLQGLVGANTTTERVGEETATGTAERVGGNATWRHRASQAVQTTVAGGGSVGLAQPEHGPSILAWGAAATLGVSGYGSWYTLSADYSVSHDENLSGLRSWTLGQRASLTGDTAAGPVVLRAIFAASAARKQDPLLGALTNRVATLTVLGYWRRHQAQATVGASDGLSAALQNPGVVDGLFLSPDFDTHNRFATLSATTSFFTGRLALTAVARTLATTAPGRDEIWEHGAGLTASYAIGEVTLSLENRISTGGIGEIAQTGNLVMFRLARSFGLGL